MADDIDTHALIASPGAGRLDRWLAKKLPVSRARLQSLIKQGAVLVDGLPSSPSTRLGGGERIIVSLPPPPPSGLIAQDIPVDIVFEDEHLLVVSKPTGLVVHPARSHPDGTLVNALLHHIRDGGGDPARPGIVHRIDKGTSGLLVVARTEDAHTHLSAQFAARTAHRRYVALCWGQTPETATIVTAHGRHPRDRIKFAAVEEGKRAVTHLRTFQHGRPEGTGQGGEVSLVGCRLETGRTHQIRVHLEHINHPVVGDPLYGAGRKRPSAWAPLLAGLDHQLLHAAELGFIHPATGEQMHFEGPPEDDFAALIARLGFVWPSSEALASI